MGKEPSTGWVGDDSRDSMGMQEQWEAFYNSFDILLRPSKLTQIPQCPWCCYKAKGFM